MPPKKPKATSGNGPSNDGGSQTFRWTQELDFKLLCLIMIPRSGIGAKEHAELAEKLGVPTAGGVRNRVAKIKSDYRKAYEELGISDPAGATAPGTKSSNKSEGGAKSKKRAAKEVVSEEDDDGDLGSSKKFKLDVSLENGYVKEEMFDDEL